MRMRDDSWVIAAVMTILEFFLSHSYDIILKLSFYSVSNDNVAPRTAALVRLLFHQFGQDLSRQIDVE